VNARLRKRRRLRETGSALGLGCLLVITGLQAASETPTPPNQAPVQANSGDLRFAVAHQHMASWCYGYLYVSGSQVRYEVVQPQSDQRHSFTADRANVVVSHRTLFGQPAEALKDFLNLKVKGQSYNFLWLANESEVRNGGAHRMSPPAAALPDTLLSAFQSPVPGAPPMPANVAAASQPRPSDTSSPASGATAPNPQAQPAAAQEPVPQGDVRFAVAHHHKDASWCYGYLYVTHDQVRYEVVQPEADRAHAFAINRSSVTARRWVTQPGATAERIQSAQDAFELAFQGKVHHFRWLANQDDVTSGNARPASPPMAAPPDILIKTILMPKARMPWITPRPSPVLPSKLEFAMHQIKDARRAVWR